MTEKKGSLFVISGPSGAGKGTLCKEILKRYPQFSLSVSATTRNMRDGEKEGESYYFINHYEFQTRVKEGHFLEWAEFCGNYYGTPKAAVLEKLTKGQNVILEIEVNGALSIKKLFPEAVLCFVVPPDFDELYSRLKGRGTESDDVIKDRIDRAINDFSFFEEYDYMILNDEIDKAVERFIKVADSAGMRTKNNKLFAEKFLSDAKKA